MWARPPLDGTIVVTGASSGIGEALCRLLAAEAQTLILVARRKERLEDLRDALRAVHDLEVIVAPCDLTDSVALETLLEILSEHPVDILINNAGLGDIALFEHSDWSKLDRMITLNVTALTRLTHSVLPGMKARGRGGILNISSGFGVTFMPAAAAYIGTKHYVSGFTEGLGLEVGSLGIAVCHSCPGPVATEFESHAGNPTGQSVPSFLELTAEQAARHSLWGFRHGLRQVYPGWLMGSLIKIGVWTPKSLLRMIYAPLAGLLRKPADLP